MTTPDLTTYLAVHGALRRGAHDLVAGVTSLDGTDRRRAGALVRWWRGYAGEVLAHHTVEDDFFFPALVARVPEAVALVDRTDGDHEHLDELMTAITAAMAALPHGGGRDRAVTLHGELAAHMDEHLDFEDEQVLPLFERHFTGEEYDALDAQAVKSLGIGKQAAFTVPFVAAALGDDREQVLGDAPLPFRVLYHATRGRYARLTAAAFGASAERPRVGASTGS